MGFVLSELPHKVITISYFLSTPCGQAPAKGEKDIVTLYSALYSMLCGKKTADSGNVAIKVK